MQTKMESCIESSDEGCSTGSKAHIHAMLKSGKFHLGLIFIVFGLLIFHFRRKIFELYSNYHNRRRMRYLHLEDNESFRGDMENGLTSENFDVSRNIDQGDTRAGLSKEDKSNIKALMEEESLSFDEARLKYTQERLKQNNIRNDGMPLDPKTVTF